MIIRIEKKSIWFASFQVILFGMLQGFYFIDTDIRVGGIHVLNLFYMYAIVWFIVAQLLLRNIKVEYEMYDYLIILVVVLCFLASCIGNNNYGGGIVVLFLKQKNFWLMALLYFPLKKLIRIGIISVDMLEKCLINWGIIYVSVIVIQYIFYVQNNIVFLHVARNVTGERFYYSTVLYEILGFFCLDRFLKGKKMISCLFVIFLALFSLLQIQRYRNNFLAFCLAILIGLVLSKSNKFKWMAIPILGIAALLLYNTEKVQNIIYAFTNIRNDVTVFWRIRWINYAVEEITHKNYFGKGYVDENNKIAVMDAIGSLGRRYFHLSYKISEHGIFGFAYDYGFQGVIWFTLIIFKSIKDSWILYVEHDLLYPFIFFLLMVFQCINEIHWYEPIGMLLFVIMYLIVSNYEIRKKYTN